MEFVLETQGLTKSYRNIPVVNGVTMRIKNGDIYGFVGRNGAGKTTLMRIVSGLVAKSGGGYSLFGCPDTDARLDGMRRKMGAIIEAPSVYPAFTAEQNLKMQCMAGGIDDFSSVPEVLELVGLAGTGNKKAKDFSLGMRQRLGIASALITRPEFLILDEPVNGLDPQGIFEVRELLKTLNRERGITIFISSHLLGELAKLATSFGFIERGMLLNEVTAEELEHACRKSLVLHMSGIVRFAEAMNSLHIGEYRVLSQTSAEIFADVTVSALAFALRDVGLELLRVVENDVDLERYFMEMIGGVRA